MKWLFIETRWNGAIDLPEKLIQKLSGKVALFTTVQFIGSVQEIKTWLEHNGMKVVLHKPLHAKYKGQVLGCSIDKFEADSFLYIGDGEFHPKALVLKNNKPVHAYNPYTKELRLFTEKDIELWKRHEKAALLKFYASENIGVILSTKPGQAKKPDLSAFKDKKFYYFLFDTIDFSGLENFPFIDCWINTACPRIAYDDYKKFPKPVINVESLFH